MAWTLLLNASIFPTLVIGDIISGFLDSDSDGSDCDMLPWQPDWFLASSDEDLGDDDEDE